MMHSITKYSSNDYLIVGSSYTKNNKYDAWLVCIDKEGILIFDKMIGQQYSDYARSIIMHSKDNYAILGDTYSNRTMNYGAWIMFFNK